MATLKLVSWNVNGIRACSGKGFKDIFDNFDADAFCLQETKASPDQVDQKSLLSKPEHIQQVWSSAEKKGYSGTATFTPDKKLKLLGTLRLGDYDREGRGTIL